MYVRKNYNSVRSTGAFISTKANKAHNRRYR